MSFLAAAVLALGAAPAQEEFDGVVRLGGSSTLLPVIAECANAFMEKHHTWDAVDASFPAVPIVIFVTGGGSGFGVKAVTTGTVDLGLSTRELKEAEKAAIGAHETFLVGKDCLAPATHRSSPLAARSGLTREEAVRLLAGEVTRWSALDASLTDGPVVLLVRDMAGSANELLQSKLLEKRTLRADALQLASMGAIQKRLEDNPNAFAFLSSGMAGTSAELKAYELDGVAPTNANVLSGEYPLTRPMLLVAKGEATPHQKAFVDFVLADGQALVAAHGYVPVKSPAAR